MKAVRLFLILAFVSLSTSLLFNGAGYAAPFECEGDTISYMDEINIDLDTGKCSYMSSSSTEIKIENVGDGKIYLTFTNGASAKADPPMEPDFIEVPSGSRTALICIPDMDCSISVAFGTYNSRAFDFDLERDAGNRTPVTLTSTSRELSPEIDVTETGQKQGDIADGGTLDQGTQAVGSATTLTFTVTNSGDDDLELDTATSSALSNVTVNAISAPGSTTVSPSGTTTFTVQYTPTSAAIGPFSFDLSFANNDGDENPYNFTVAGTAVAPSPEISVAETGLGQGDIADGGTLGQGTPIAGSATTLTFTVTNSGTADLTLGTATFSHPTNVTVNAISSPGSTTVSPNGTTTFTVKYTPTSPGGFEFDLSFANNDDNENPYDFTITGRAVAPEIAVDEIGQGPIADGGTLDQGTQTAGFETTLTFTVTNSGDADLMLGTAASSDLTNVNVNSISAPGSTTVSPSGSTTFTVKYSPTSGGAFSFDLSFANNDSDEDPFNLTVAGTALAPEIEVAETGQKQGDIADGGTLDQGTQTPGTATTLTFTVTNSGNADLTLATAAYDSANNVTVNAISSPGSTTVSPSGTTTFTVEYTPNSGGAFSFDLSFSNNDHNENPYNFTVSGEAGAPEIVVEWGSPAQEIGNWGKLAHVNQTAGSETMLNFTVTNSGNADLTLENMKVGSLVNVTNAGLMAQGVTTVPPGGETFLAFAYTPIDPGKFSLLISFDTNDSDENPYTVLVVGTALAPEISVSSSEGGAIADGGADAIASKPTAGKAASVTYTISNSGAAPLSITAPTISTNVTSTTNVTVNSLTLASASVPAGGTTTLEVNYTPTTSGTFSFAFNFVNSDSDESPFNITASGSSVGVPHGVAASSGDGQATPINTSFANPLVAIVTDSDGNALSGVSVTFGAPSSGASLTFASTGTRTETVVTGADGKATSSTMTANATASSFSGGALTPYSVSASVSGLTSASYSLTNARDSAADIAKTSDVIATFMTSRADRIVSAQAQYRFAAAQPVRAPEPGQPVFHECRSRQPDGKP